MKVRQDDYNIAEAIHKAFSGVAGQYMARREQGGGVRAVTAYSRTEVDASPDLKLAWQRGRLDARCLSCGATMAATSRCYRCRGVLEYREHLPGSDPRGPSRTAAPVQWCQQGEVRRPDPSNPRTGVPRAEWLAKARTEKAAREATPSKVTR